eukprot:CAMPEP_0178617402 /NCGR_PEP_ID=MMETSP0698-20121128/3701_1 /TAXON_ID=265572 /ORGANISM="Extubocellulus spinifer, Strain CCMP396" /LENGTH=335 /DNA_ID=CAMNT_0020256247 /DNA_START=479 /DNA_END=1486 /DNA_ORIENTATION=+
MNYEKYPWLRSVGLVDERGTCGSGVEYLNLSQLQVEAHKKIQTARTQYLQTGAVTFPEFVEPSALASILEDCTAKEDAAFTTDDTHTPHQLQVDETFDPPNSVRNLKMRTHVASIAYDELPPESELVGLYKHPTLLALVSAITGHDGSNGFAADLDGAGNGIGRNNCSKLYLSEDPLGACSINVFRPTYAHSFHFDESEFSTTIMIREADMEGSGLFQFTPPLRKDSDDLALDKVGRVIRTYCASEEGQEKKTFPEGACNADTDADVNVQSACPPLHTLPFKAGTLSIFSGSRSLHRVTEVKGTKSRLTAVLTYSTKPGFRNSKEVQQMFWGRSV